MLLANEVVTLANQTTSGGCSRSFPFSELIAGQQAIRHHPRSGSYTPRHPRMVYNGHWKPPVFTIQQPLLPHPPNQSSLFSSQNHSTLAMDAFTSAVSFTAEEIVIVDAETGYTPPLGYCVIA